MLLDVLRSIVFVAFCSFSVVSLVLSCCLLLPAGLRLLLLAFPLLSLPFGCFWLLLFSPFLFVFTLAFACFASCFALLLLLSAFLVLRPLLLAPWLFLFLRVCVFGMVSLLCPFGSCLLVYLSFYQTMDLKHSKKSANRG